MRIDAENLLNNDDCALCLAGWLSNVGLQLVAVGCGELNGLAHFGYPFLKLSEFKYFVLKNVPTRFSGREN